MLGGLLAALLAVLPSRGAEPLLRFDRADAVPTTDIAIPPDDFLWDPVALPHAWFRDPRAMPFGWLWYRIRFELAQVPAEEQRLYLPRVSSHQMEVYVNREKVWQQSEALAEGTTLNALLIAVPPRLLRPGANVIHIRMQGWPKWLHGLSSVQLGPAAALAREAGLRTLIQGQMVLAMAIALGLAGLLSLALWRVDPRDSVLFWYGVSGVGLLVATALWQLTLWRPDFGEARAALVFLRFYGFLTPLFVLHLRLAGRRHPGLEAALWLLVVAACASIGVRHPWNAEAWAVWGIAYSLLPLCFLALLVPARVRHIGSAVWLLMLADLAAAAFSLHDWAMRAGLLDFDQPMLIFFVVPFIMLAAAAPIAQRYLEGRRAIERSRDESERQERALASERRRIMADMHDGIGARLVGLLSMAQSGRAAPRDLEAGLAEALVELRTAIDSLQPVEGDVGVVLGNVRHRMRSVFDTAGVRFAWRVGELPRLDDLTPARILAIQRLLLEVFTNAIKHARASTVTVRTELASGALRIIIEDDGQGFEVGAAHDGRGLENLRLRALQAGGMLDVTSVAGKGTRVVLALHFWPGDPPPGVAAANASR